MGKLKYQNPAIKLWDVAVRIAESEDDDNEGVRFKGENVAVDIKKFANVKQENQVSVSTQVSKSQKITATATQSAVPPKSEIDEIVDLLKGMFASVGSENRSVLDLNTFDFEEFRESNILLHKMYSRVGKVSTAVILQMQKEFIAKINSLILLSEAKGCTVNTLNSLKSASSGLVALNGKKHLNVVQEENWNKKQGKEVDKGFSR